MNMNDFKPQHFNWRVENRVATITLKGAERKNPITFFRETQEASLMAFSTASSNATLPTALRVADERLHLPPRIARFVLTVGATANQNGTAMFEGVTVLFLAQFFGLDLTIWQQLTVMLVCILGGIGTAGVPAGSLPVVALILAMVGRRPVPRHVPDHLERRRRSRRGPGHLRGGAGGQCLARKQARRHRGGRSPPLIKLSGHGRRAG